MIKALNDFVIVEKVKDKETDFALPFGMEKAINDCRKVQVVSIFEDKEIKEGDIIYIQSGSLMQLEDFFFIKKQSIICKESDGN